MPKELPTMQEVQQKLFLTNKDIQVMFSCGASKAVEIKKAIQSHQDSYGGIFKSRVSMTDVRAWLKANRNKTKGDVN